MQKSIFPQIILKSLCITTKSLYTNSKFQTQLSRKLQRFRTCRKNKKCSIFHDLSEYIIFSYDCKLLDWSFNPGLRSVSYMIQIFNGRERAFFKMIEYKNDMILPFSGTLNTMVTFFYSVMHSYGT